MTALYLSHHPGWSRERLIRRLKERLLADGVAFHERSLRRQLGGAVESVPPELEELTKRVLFEDTPIKSEEDLERAINAAGLIVARRDARYVVADRAVLLTRLWLFLNPGLSKRALAKRLCDDLASQGIAIGLDALQSELAGRGQLVRREVIDTLLRYLDDKGIHSELEAQQRLSDWHEELAAFETGRGLVDGRRFRALAKLWQVRHHEASSRRLAALLRDRLAGRGIHVGLDHLQRLVGGKARRVRVEVVAAMEAMVREEMSPEQLDSALKEQLSPARTTDLAWVLAKPISELAKEWLEANPGLTMRQLALRVADAARKMGYSTSHNTIQPILGGWKQRTRGYIYRAMLAQFEGQKPADIPPEHVLAAIEAEPNIASEAGPVEGALVRRPQAKLVEVPKTVDAAPRDVPSLDAFMREAKRTLPKARSPHVLKLLARRANKLFGIDPVEAEGMLKDLIPRRGRPTKGANEGWDDTGHVPESDLTAEDAIGTDVGSSTRPPRSDDDTTFKFDAPDLFGE
ncbi:MAG: hypothetical protein U1E65_31900 [Myxococcota bacterium]